MTEVQVGFCSVFRDENLAVLVRAHRARIHIDIRIQFLRNHLVSFRLQKTPQRCCRNSFSQAGYDAACHKNVFYVFHFILRYSIP